MIPLNPGQLSTRVEMLQSIYRGQYPSLISNLICGLQQEHVCILCDHWCLLGGFLNFSIVLA
jgi:hypothetical protein